MATDPPNLRRRGIDRLVISLLRFITNRRTSAVIYAGIGLLFLCLVATGSKRFRVWNQITSATGMTNEEFESRLIDPSNPEDPKEELEQSERLKRIQVLAGELRQTQMRRLKASEKLAEGSSESDGTDQEAASREFPQTAGGVLKEIFAKPSAQNWNMETLSLVWSLVVSAAQDASLQYAHVPRISLMYSVVLISRLLHLNLHLVFSIYTILLFGAISFLLDEVARVYLGRDDIRLAHVFAIGFGILSIFMNGRMVFGMMSAALMLWVECQSRASVAIPPKRFVAPLIAILWCGSVSTGVFAAMYTSALVWKIFFYRRRAFVLWAVMIAASPWYFASFLKNLWYYGGNIFEMLVKHGLLHFKPVLVVAVVLLLIVLWRLRNLLLPRPTPAFALAISGFALVVAAFGHTTATVAVPPLFLIALLRITQTLLESAPAGEIALHREFV